MPDIDDSPEESTSRRWRRAPSQSSASRAAVMGLDNLERKFGFAGAGVALLITLLFIPHLVKNTTITVTAKKLKDGKCPSGYSLVKAVCSKAEITHPSYWVVPFCFILVMGVAIAVFTYFRKRPGVIVASFMLGLASGIVGTACVAFLALGAWFSIRAFRLNKYGDPTFRGSNLRAREQATARRAARATSTRTRGAKGTKSSQTAPVTSRTPAPSKRYTPKKTSRR